MTPTASASPIALLTPVMDPATASAGNTASGANTAANAEGDVDNALLPTLSGGFQLLIDAAAQQQTAAQTPLKTSTKTTPAANAGSNEDGNVLPLLGALLPAATDAIANGQVAGQQIIEDADKSSDDKTTADQANADNTPVQLLWVPVNVQPPAPVAPVAANSSDTGVDGKSSSGLALVTAPSVDPTKTALADAASPVGGEDTAPLQSSGLMPNKQLTGERNAATPADVLAAASNSTTKLDVAPQDLIGAAQKPSETTSFADLLKSPISTAAANPLTASLDSSRTQQAARPYVEMNSTGATVAVPVGSSGWSDAVVDKVMWFSANKFSSAEIQLNPPDLGPLQVRISTQHDQASVVFSSPHAAVRDALDQALPRLRDMLGGQGIQLADASVGGQGAQAQQQSAQQQNGERRAAATSGFFQGDDNNIAPAAVSRVQMPRLPTSAVDAYA